MRQSYTKENSKEITDRVFTLVKRMYKEEKKFRYDDSKVIFVCSPSADVDPRVVATLLGSCDSNAAINHQWVPSSESSSLKVWYGAIATFSSETFARVAVDTIQSEHRFLKVLFFKEIIDIFLRAEILSSKPSGESTRIIFRAPKHLFPDKHIPHIKSRLRSFGKPTKAQLNRSEMPDNVILNVEYPAQFQAYASKLVMDRCGFKEVGIVSVELVVTESGKKFDKLVNEEFKKRIADKYK